jgi:putative heme iron utilization protein
VAKRARRAAFAAARPLQVLGWTVAAIVAVTVLALGAFDRSEDPLCATRTQQALVRSELARNPQVWLVDLAHDLHIPEAVVLDALPDSERVGVRGTGLPGVWAWLRLQPDLALALHSGRHTWRVRGSLPALRQFQRGDWHVGDNDDVLSGRISTADVGVIYARTARNPGEPAWTVFFLDRGGEILFQVAPATPSGSDQSPTGGAVRALRSMRGLDEVCRRG